MSEVVRDWQAGTPLARALFVFIATAFLVAPAPVWSLVFYALVIPLFLLCVWRERPRAWFSGYAILAVLLIAWSCLTLLWGQHPGGPRVFRLVVGSLCTLIYVPALLIVLHEDARNARSIGSIMIAFGVANAVLSIALFAGPDMLGQRMPGWAETRQPILGASIIGNCMIFALSRALSERAHRWLLALAAAVLFGFIVLTGSRGPLGAVLAAGLVLACTLPRAWQIRIAVLIVVAAMAVWLAAPGMVGHMVADLSARGGSHRPEIWHHTLEQVGERPWFGWGIAAYLKDDEFTFPHSLYLSTLFYDGIVGFGMLMVLIVGIGIDLLRRPGVADRPLLLALWVNALLSGATDLGQLANGPGPLWFILWLPAALSIDALNCARVTAAVVPHTTGPEPAARQIGAS